MAQARMELSLEEELMILLFWAYGRDIARKLGPGKVQAVPGLKEAVNAVMSLPAAIGWDDRESFPPFEERLIGTG